MSIPSEAHNIMKCILMSIPSEAHNIMNIVNIIKIQFILSFII